MLPCSQKFDNQFDNLSCVDTKYLECLILDVLWRVSVGIVNNWPEQMFQQQVHVVITTKHVIQGQPVKISPVLPHPEAE